MLGRFCANRNSVPKVVSVINCNVSTCHKEHQISVNGQSINYLKTGNGSHTVLCFPGALGSIWTDFKPQIENLNKTKFTIIAWDPPGYGFSRPPNRQYTRKFYETDADIAFEFMKILGVNKFSLLGWSDGGISSMILAAKHPDAVRRLVIWGANSYITQEEVEIYEKIRDISKWSDNMKAPLIAIYGKEVMQDMWNKWCDELKNIHDECEGNICKEKLHLIQCPTLILHGDKDPMVASEHPDYLLKNIPGARLHRYPNGKHNIHLRYAEDFNEIVTTFLEENYKSKV